MRTPALLCRQREAYHRLIASQTLLDNVRKVALIAAAAWEKEAITAEAREAGGSPKLSAGDAEILRVFREEDLSGTISEAPE